jgi:arylsulfatase A-like enzyme
VSKAAGKARRRAVQVSILQVPQAEDALKAILVIFDSLSREFLPPYGNDWVKAPNFLSLADRTVTFDRCYVGSMPCMPARRELHTGRYNFLHRAWGPLEPFDDSMPEILARHGVYSHLVSDHYHYWEDGGATYHNRYASWEIIRGQEGDKWKGDVADPVVPAHLGTGMRQDWVNRKYMVREEDTTQARTFGLALEFLEKNGSEDNWFLQVECFDPHPPFFVPDRYRDLYADGYSGPQFDWPHYAPVSERESPEAVEHCRRQYAALISMCDHSLGRVMDAMDRHGLWEDTMLIVTTDHGFLLGEHGWWAFVRPPFYSPIANKPLFIWDPRTGRHGERNTVLVQTHDLPATLLELFGIDAPAGMQGRPLRPAIASGTPVREAALFGVFGGHVNCTDGRTVYMRAPVNSENAPLYNYTLMPTHMKQFFGMEELRTAELAGPFSFTKGAKVLRTDAAAFMAQAYDFGHLLFDLERDPREEHPLHDPDLEQAMIGKMIRLMAANDAPREQFERLGLPESAG